MHPPTVASGKSTERHLVQVLLREWADTRKRSCAATPTPFVRLLYVIFDISSRASLTNSLWAMRRNSPLLSGGTVAAYSNA